MTQEFHRLAREEVRLISTSRKTIRQQWTQTLAEISDKLQADKEQLALLKLRVRHLNDHYYSSTVTCTISIFKSVW